MRKIIALKDEFYNRYIIKVSSQFVSFVELRFFLTYLTKSYLSHPHCFNFSSSGQPILTGDWCAHLQLRSLQPSQFCHSWGISHHWKTPFYETQSDNFLLIVCCYSHFFVDVWVHQDWGHQVALHPRGWELRHHPWQDHICPGNFFILTKDTWSRFWSQATFVTFKVL